MPIYDVIVLDELSFEFTNDNPLLPNGFRILGPVDDPAPPGSKRFRVQDDNAPAWTEGKLISPEFTSDYEVNDAGYPTGNVTGTRITAYATGYNMVVPR